jgi:GT2 family glycosyltransferase
MKTLAIIVNYKSASLTVQAVHSVLQAESLGPVRVVVIDNSADARELATLKANLPFEVYLLVNSENRGFGRACNQAFEQSDEEWILLLNPDARLMPRALVRLQSCLVSSSRIAATGPKIFWDDSCRFLLPPSLPVWLMRHHFLLHKGGLLRIWGNLLKKYWRKHALTIWQGDKPVQVSNLSGGHALVKRTAVSRVGGLFDPQFFLYFEDTDLFLRLKKAGYHLYVAPQASVVHWYNQSGQGQEQAHKQVLMNASAQIFWKKHGRNRIGQTLFSKCVSCVHDKPDISPEAEYFQPFQLAVPDRYQQEWLFEWSPDPSFIPAAGCFGTGGYMEFPEKCWNMLAPGTYYGRLGSAQRLDGKEVVISWTVG